MDKTNDDARAPPVEARDPTPERERPNSQLETLASHGDALDDDDDAAPAPERGADAPAPDPVEIDRFVVLRRVGEGGMGVVYAAYDNELERRVAIKLVRAQIHGDTGARIRREAQALARLSHPNVVQVYEVGSHDGQLFVAMEFITGPTLAQWARELDPGPARWRTVLDTYIEVGRGLAAAHAARIVHRDFKPANAIVGQDGRVRVLDFGIARAAAAALDASPEPGGSSPRREAVPDGGDPIESHAVDATLTPGELSEISGRSGSSSFDPLATPLTQTGALMGTPAYMSPEQFERRTVGPASDQFSFCIALWEALYGERPFAGDNPAALMVAVLAGQVRPPKPGVEVPAWVHQILLRGLNSEPEARWPSIEALLDALGRDPAERRRRRLRLAVLSATVTALVAGSAWFASVERRQARAAERASEEAQRLEAEAEAREAEANAARDRALIDARASAARARDTARVLAANDFADRPEIASALLRDVEDPAQTKGWNAAALRALQVPAAERVFEGHEGRVVYIEPSPDGEWIASASFDNSARLWPREGGAAIVIPHPGHVLSARFDNSGTRLLTACRDGNARVWSLARLIEADARGEQAEPDHLLGGHEDLLWSANWSRDGTKIVSSSRDGTIRIWSGDELGEARVESIPGNVWWAEFSPRDRWIVASSSWAEVKAWSVDEPERPAIDLRGHTASVGDIHFSPTGYFIATASVDGKIRLYHHDPEAGPDPDPYAVLEHDAEVFRLRFSRDGLRLISSSRDHSAKLWQFDQSGAVQGPPRVFATGEDVAWSADFSPDGRLAAIGEGSGVAELWPLEGGPPIVLRGHVADVFRVRFAPDGRTLYTASHDGSVRAWDLDLSRVARELDDHRGPVHALELRGPVLAAGSADGTVRLWSGLSPGTEPAVSAAPVRLDSPGALPTIALGGRPHLLASGDEHSPLIRVWQIQGALVRAPERPLLELELPTRDGVFELAFDPSAALLAAASSDGHVYVWRLGDEPGADLGPPLALHRHYLHQPSVTRVAFSPDGQTLVSGGGDRLLAVWSTAELRAAAPGEPPTPRLLTGHGSRIYSLSFAPDSSRIATGSLDTSARVWNLDDPDMEVRAFEHGDFVVDVAIDPSGTLLASACTDTRTYLWDLEGGARTRVLGAAGGEVRDVEFSPDGALVASVATDGRLRLFPVDGGAPFEFDTGSPLAALGFSPDGARIAAAGSGDALMLWYLGEDLSPTALQRRLAEQTQVCLDVELRMAFIGESRERAEAHAAACDQGNGLGP